MNSIDIKKMVEITTSSLSTTEEEIDKGISRLFSLFITAEQQLFPRKIMTAITNGTITVNSREEMLQRFKEANFLDCRINGYPEILVKNVMFIPRILFIDIDIDWTKKSNGQQLAKSYVDKTIKNIIFNCAFTVEKMAAVPYLQLFTGNGYHIYIGLPKSSMPYPLEKIKEYNNIIPKLNAADNVNGLSREFLIFAKQYLSDNKADTKSNPSFKSCLLRVPNSINSKNNALVKEELFYYPDKEVKAKVPADIALMYSGFRTYILSLEEKYKASISMATNRIRHKARLTNNNKNKKIRYVDTLLQMQIKDSRKTVVNTILIPYFVNIKNLDDAEVIDRLKTWLAECNKVRSLYASNPRYSYDNAIRYNVQRCKVNPMIKPLKFDKLQITDPQLYKEIKSKMDMENADKRKRQSFMTGVSSENMWKIMNR